MRPSVTKENKPTSAWTNQLWTPAPRTGNDLASVHCVRMLAGIRHRQIEMPLNCTSRTHEHPSPTDCHDTFALCRPVVKKNGFTVHCICTIPQYFIWRDSCRGASQCMSITCWHGATVDLLNNWWGPTRRIACRWYKWARSLSIALPNLGILHTLTLKLDTAFAWIHPSPSCARLDSCNACVSPFEMLNPLASARHYEHSWRIATTLIGTFAFLSLSMQIL